MLLCRSVLVVLLAFGVCGCKNLLSPTTPAFGSTEAQALAKQIASVSANAVNAMTAASRNGVTAPALAPAPRSLLGPQGWSCNSAGTSCLVNYPYSSGANCSAGGRYSASGTISGTLSVGNLGAFGNISAQQTLSFLNCVLLTGWTTNGDPYISDAGTITFTGQNSSFSFQENGGVLTTSTNGKDSVSCQEHTNVIWSSATGGSITGSITCVPGDTWTVSGSF